MNINVIRTWASICGLSIALPVMVALAIMSGPAVEVTLYPVIEAEHVAGSVMRDETKLCWKTRFHKFRNNNPSYFDYKVIWQGLTLSVNAYRIDPITNDHVFMSAYGFAYHPAGSIWIGLYCFDLPSVVKPAAPFQVRGTAVYDSSHILVRWNLEQELPSFYVEGLVPKVDGGAQP